MSNRLGGFIAGQNINASIGTVAFSNTPDLFFGSAAGTPAVGQPVQFTTTGTLPTGISLNTTYYVISVSSNTCQVSTTQGGSATTYTNGTGSGTHTAVTQRAFNPYAGAPDTVEYLVVAGGGGAGGAPATGYGGPGGGGAGGVLTAAGFSVAAGSALTITVGAGGAGSTGNGSNGSNSVFSSLTSTGGGGGGGQTGGYTGSNGGSGGGGAGYGAGNGGTGTSGQGNAGGKGDGSGNWTGGGGGGAGSVGDSAPTTTAQTSGGAGICSAITGQRVFYAGGGGAGGFNATVFGLGGGAGAGNGVLSGTGGAGVANTGSGGGGASGATGGTGGAGGSGIVIVRYPQINSAPALVTGSPQVSYSDGYQIYTWTSSGSIIF